MLRTSIKVYLNTLATVHTHHLRVPTHFADQNMWSSLHLQKGKLSDQGEETVLSSIVSIMFCRANQCNRERAFPQRHRNAAEWHMKSGLMETYVYVDIDTLRKHWESGRCFLPFKSSEQPIPDSQSLDSPGWPKICNNLPGPGWDLCVLPYLTLSEGFHLSPCSFQRTETKLQPRTLYILFL